MSDKYEVAKIFSSRNTSYGIEKINGINIYSDTNYVFVVNKDNIIYSLTDAYMNLIISNDELVLLNNVIDYSDFYEESKFVNASYISNIVLEDKNYKARYYAPREYYYIILYIDINFRKHIFTTEDFKYLSFTELEYTNGYAHEKFVDGTYVEYPYILDHPHYRMWFKDLDSRAKAIDYLMDNKPYYIQGLYDYNLATAA